MDKSNQKQRKVSLLQSIAIILCGLFLVLVTLEIGLRVSGFIMISLQEYKNLQSFKEKGSCRIMCLGESTTQDQYPPHLQKSLNQRNIGIKFSVIDRGLAGIDTGVILAQLEANFDKYQPDIVVTMMGCNDRRTMYYQDIPEADTWLFRHCRVYRFSRLIYMHILKKLKKEDIYRVKIPRPNQSKPLKIEGSSDNPVRLNPKDNSEYTELGQLYRDQGRHTEAEQALKKAIELNPKNDYAYAELGWLYKKLGRYAESEQVFKKAIGLNPGNKRTYGGLATIYCEMGRNELSKTYADKLNSLWGGDYNPATINNYHKLKQILDKRKIKLVCVQYPMRSVQPLKKIFKDDEGVIFVDNERIFKDAIRKEGYDEYFVDMFGGNFGHCTQKGNRLLGENIANTILKEIFGK